MLARCARCQNTFTTDHFGRQTCPHCGSELLLADPNAPAAPPPGAPAGAPPPAESPGGVPPAPAAGLPPPPEGSPAWGASPPGPGGAAPPPPSAGWGPLPPPPPAATPALAAPFADRAARGFLASYLETWRLASLEPQKFFGHVRVDQAGAAIAFGLLTLVVGSIFSGLYSLLVNRVTSRLTERLTERAGAHPHVPLLEWMQAHQNSPGTLVGSVVGYVVLFFVGAAVIHGLLLLFRGGGRGFGATLTVVGYSYAPWLVMVLPVPGLTGLVAFVWQVVILIVGLAAAQRISQGKSAAAVLLPVVFACCCIGCGGLMVGMKAVSEAVQSAPGGTEQL